MIDEYVDQMRGKPEDLVRTIERYLLEQETKLYPALSIYLGLLSHGAALRGDEEGVAELVTSGLVRRREGVLRSKDLSFDDISMSLGQDEP